ncbi:MAG: hypothetical protein N3A01_09430 [Bacteroidales bacterium]|nr:hypothetical protein [Bacteroidales bacterium]
MKKNILLVVVFILLLSKCVTEYPENLPNIDVKFYYFYKELFETPVDSIPQKVPYFAKKYYPFYDLFCVYVINIEHSGTVKHPLYLQAFVSDYNMQKVYQYIQKKYPSTSDVNEQIIKSLRHLKYYFPEIPVPTVYYYHGGFNKPIIASDSLIGIGLDMYLGKNCEFYPQLKMPYYRIRKTEKDYIVFDAIFNYFGARYPFNFKADNVLSNIIHEGRLLYVIKKILPFIPDTIIFGFSEKQLKWCEKSERSMWRFLIDKKKLFSTNMMDIKRYTNDGMFTTTFPRESPARAAVWLGYKIVEKYMQENENITLKELLQEDDYQKILRKAYYNP